MATAPRQIASGFSFLEGPRWHDGRLWMSDFYTHQVISMDESGGDQRTEAEVAEQPSGLGWLPDGRLLVVSMRDYKLLRREADGSLVEHADLSQYVEHPLNDMLVDEQGRAYVGSFGFDLMSGEDPKPTTLILVEPDGSTRIAADDLMFPNGVVTLDGGATLVVAESFGNRMSAFTVTDNGSLAGRREWARFGPSWKPGQDLFSLDVIPDGTCAASDGTIWVADAGHQRAVRVAEGGEIVQEVSGGDLGIFACTLGGADGDTLFMCAAPGYEEDQRRATREAVVLAAKV
ncbi:MAG TPA: SMP-30/gluconolactonase/LRE family protein [Pseudonocardia sp.]|nr:SMP-30/gluconolactonase/LRE family protein [Pseudonocardia sp.]